MNKSKNIKKPLSVAFTDKGFINSELLNEYDLDGQIYELTYLLRTQNWKIENNRIVFPEIKDETMVSDLIAINTNKYILQLLEARKNEITNCSIYGIQNSSNRIEKEIQHYKNRIESCQQRIEESKQNIIDDELEMEE